MSDFFWLVTFRIENNWRHKYQPEREQNWPERPENIWASEWSGESEAGEQETEMWGWACEGGKQEDSHPGDQSRRGSRKIENLYFCWEEKKFFTRAANQGRKEAST